VNSELGLGRRFLAGERKTRHGFVKGVNESKNFLFFTQQLNRRPSLILIEESRFFLEEEKSG
jgi:hypothetical protein